MSDIQQLKGLRSGFLAVFAKAKRSAFVKNLLIVMSGTALAQAFGYALYPFISRLYTPEDFGVFGSFYAVLGIVGTLLTLDYSQAIMLPKAKEDAINLFALSCLVVAAITAICLLVCLIVPGYVQGLVKAPHRWVLALVVLGIFADGVNQASQAWCIRVKSFKHTSASQVVRSMTTNGTQLGLGYLKGGPMALVFAGVLGNSLASANLARVAARDVLSLRLHIKWERIKRLAQEYRDFPLYSASTNLIDMVSLGLPIFLLTHYYGLAAAGAFAFANRILSAPLGLVQRALRQVLYQKASETHNTGDSLLSLYVKFTAGLFAVGIVPTLVFVVWAPGIFTLIFGAQWLTAGIFAQSLTLWLLFMFCNLPALLCARIARMQRKMFFFNLVTLAARSLALVAGGMYLSAPHTVLAFSMVGVVINLYFILIVGAALRKMEGKTAWKDILAGLKGG